MERFNFDEFAAEDETLHLDIRNIESRSRDHKEWNKLAKDLIDRGNYYKFIYENSKSEYAKEKLESLYDLSITASNKSTEVNPRNIDSWYNKGIALSNLGKFEEAIKCYDRVIEIDPDYFPVWNSKGNTLNYLGKIHEAIKSYNHVLEKDSQNIIAYYNKGLALSKLGEYEKAIECYDRVIEIDPRNIDALNAKGLAFERLHKFEEAIKCYDIVIEIDPRNIEALNAKGNALERLDNYEEAEQSYKRVSEEYLNEINDMNKKAVEYQNLNKYDDAIMCYDRVISIDANNSTAWFNRGVLFYKLNKYEKAIECYDRIIGLDKYREKLKRDRQELTYKQVIEYYKTIEPNRQNMEALNAKGNALEKLIKYDEAIQIFDIVIEKNPHFVIDTIVKKGDIFMAKGEYQKAEKSYNDALKRDPNNISALDNLHKLYSNYTYQYDKAISVNKRLLNNLSISQTQNKDKIMNYIYTKSQRKNSIQAKQKNLLNEENLDVKISLSEDFIKNGNYKQGRIIAKETKIPNEYIRKQIIVKFLIIASYLLQGKKDEGISKLDKFLTYYRNLDLDVKFEENQWNFKGLIHTINTNKDVDRFTKTILRNLIDLLHGNKDSQKTLSKITAETIEKVDKIKGRKKIIQTAIISVVVVTALSIFVIHMNETVPCSISESHPINVGSNTLGIDFNPETNKAYVINYVDRTISVLDCNVPRYHYSFNTLFNTEIFNTKIVEGTPIKLENPPHDIAVSPTMNKIYVIHQSPSHSVSVIDGNNNHQILQKNIFVGKDPYDLAINDDTKKVYVANYNSGTVSVIDGEKYELLKHIDVTDKPLSVSVNQNTSKVYVTHESSNILSIIDETKDNITTISLSSISDDININSKTSKVYVSHPANNTISVIDGITDKMIKEIDAGKTPIRIDIDENGTVFVVNLGSDSVSVIDGTNDTIIKTLKIPSDRPYDVEFNSKINSAYVTNVGNGSSSTINVIKYDDDSHLNYIPVGNKPVDIDVNPETNMTYVVNYDSDSLSVINSTNEVEEIDVRADKPLSVGVNPITNKIYVSHQSPSPSVSVIDGNNNHQILQENITVGKDPLDIAVDTHSNKVYVVNYGDGTVSVIDGKTDKLIKDIDVDEHPFRITVNPTINKVYVTNEDSGTVSVIDGKTDQLIKDIDVDDNPFSIAVNPTTNNVYVGYTNSPYYSVIDGTTDTLIKDNSNETVKIPLLYKCPSDIAINQKETNAYVIFDCKGNISWINESNDSILAKTTTLGTNNTRIGFNSATDKIYVVDSASNIVYVEDVEDVEDVKDIK
jgi:YVTN family beta-propeller protein